MKIRVASQVILPAATGRTFLIIPHSLPGHNQAQMLPKNVAIIKKNPEGRLEKLSCLGGLRKLYWIMK
jgi:hypothetical protein